MKIRKLKELLKTNYILQKSDDRLCIGSAYIHDLISIDRDTLEIKLRDSIRGFEELERIYKKCKELIDNGEMKEIIDGDDDILDMKPIFIFNSKEGVICSYTDDMEWPNTDYTGRLLYENTTFKTKKEAIEFAIKELNYILKREIENLNEETKQLERIKSELNHTYSMLSHLNESLNGVKNESND